MSSWINGYVQGMKQGHEKAFDECYRDLSSILYNLIKRICLNNDTSNDLLHDTFICIFENIHSFNDDREFIAWAKRIAFNVTYNYVKKSSSRPHEQVENINLYSKELDIETELENENLLALLFSQVTEIERLVLWLFIVEQYTHDEISTLVEKSVSYSKSIVSRTLKKLKNEEVVNRHA